MSDVVAGAPAPAHGGEMGSRIRAFDWAATPIGSPAQWSNSLRSIVSMLLGTRHPMFLWWGPELVQFYNDAYRPSLGTDRHPAALGACGREFWAEIWPAIGPQIDAVMTRGESTWNEDHLVPISRNGRVEEVYWTYSYSPVRDDDGEVGGTLVVVQEQTARVIAARRLRTLRDLAAETSSNLTQTDTWRGAMSALGANAYDLPWTLIYAASDDGAMLRLMAHSCAAVEQRAALQREFGVLRRVVETGRPLLLEDVRDLVGDLIVPPWPEPVRTAWLVPIRRANAAVPYGILAAGLSPRLPFDAEYRDFLSMAADHVAMAIANARAHEEEQRRVQVLAELSARFRELFEQAPAGVAVTSGREHRYEVANPIYLAITHRTSLVGLTYKEAFPELVDTELPAILDRVYETGEPFVAHEYRVAIDLDRAGGLTDCFFTFHVAPVKDDVATIVGLIVVAVEVSEQVRARRELQQAQARLNFTLESAGVGYWDLSLVTHVVTRSPQHDHIFGYPTGAPEWTFETFLAHVDSADRDRVGASFRRAIETGRDWRIECPIVGADGARRWIQVHGRVEGSARHGADRILGVVLDVTERRDLLEREYEVRREAERANHAKDEFFAALSHELRTPLNTILGWSELLTQGELSSEETAEALSTIHRNARVQVDMIEDLLDMSRVISGQIHLQVQSVRLPDAIANALKAVRHLADAKNVRIVTAFLAEGVCVAGDPARLEQVFWNLLGNAIKFTPSGGRVDISIERVDPRVVVSITDTGEGIAPEFLPHVFDRFRQADGKTTRAHGGLGIGLSIVRQLVELHAGTITANSAGTGCGASFTVSLPVSMETADRIGPAGRIASGSPRLLPRLDGIRILIVDDDPDARGLIRRILTGCQATVVAAASAAEALGALRQERFDLLVSDIGMPHEDGFELIRQVRSLPASEGGNIPAVALTAYARSEDRERALRSGFQMHMAKPVEQSELLAVCGSLTNRLN